MKGGGGRRWEEVGGRQEREGRREKEKNRREIIPFTSFPPWGCNVISTKIFLVGVSLRLSVCIHLVHQMRYVCLCVLLRPNTHVWAINPRVSTFSLFHSLPSPKPWVKCAMLYACMCAVRAKPAWHTKGGERYYLVSKLSLCLPYINAPKPHCLSIT